MEPARPTNPLSPRKAKAPTNTGRFARADARTRTGDPFITSEVLYQLSYVGVDRELPAKPGLLLACRVHRQRTNRIRSNTRCIRRSACRLPLVCADTVARVANRLICMAE